MTRPLVALLVPLMVGAAFGLLGTVFGLSGTAVSIAVYLGELAAAIVLIRSWLGAGAAGMASVGTAAAFALAIGLALARGATWSAVIPVERLEVGAAVFGAVAYAALVAVAEEVHFRGLLLGTLITRMGTGRALALTAVAFAVPHVFLNGLLWIPLFVADGLLFGALRLRTGSLVPPIVAHTFGNFLTGALLVSPRVVDDRVAVTYLVVALAVDALAVAWLLRPLRVPQRVPA